MTNLLIFARKDSLKRKEERIFQAREEEVNEGKIDNESQ
jgi:hypothetical protein